jgi:hypothetical protein
MTAKPIFIIRVPKRFLKDIAETQNELQKTIGKDYYILILCDEFNSDKVEFECFHEKDFNEVKYEELKQIVEDRLRCIE